MIKIKKEKSFAYMKRLNQIRKINKQINEERKKEEKNKQIS